MNPLIQAPSRCRCVVRGLFALLALGTLAACGAPPLPDLEPPRMTIVELELSTGTAGVRFDNPVSAPMAATVADFVITVEGRTLGQFAPAINLTVPPLGSELLSLTIDAESDAARHLEAAGRVRSSYRISGSLGLEGGSRLEIDSTGWLSPNPGKPGSYR